MSEHLYIEHDPFKIETKFRINKQEITVENNPFFEIASKQRLQQWVENLFPTLYKLFRGAKVFNITFKGVEADALDIELAAKQARTEGIIADFSFTHNNIASSEERLKNIQSLMEEAKTHPLFGEKIANDPAILSDFQEALNKDFDVYVAATMSAGKSTLINAMLGYDLLPAANEATTATIATIVDDDNAPLGQFKGYRLDKEGSQLEEEQIVSLATLTEWNKAARTHFIKLSGNILGIQERDDIRLVLTDTPGPNNSQDKAHRETTLRHIQDSKRNPLILYILNATQLGINDDQTVLSEIAKLMSQGGKQSKDRFIFVVNKMDAFDPEKGESIQNALNNVKQYLEKNGISNPLVYPASANLTRLLRKRASGQELTRSERNECTSKEELFLEEPTMDLVQYMPLTTATRKKLENKNLTTAEYRSGLPAIEAMIDEYIDKYNLPHRVNRAYIALNEAIRQSSNEEQLKLDLKDFTAKKVEIEQQLKVLTDSKKISIQAKAKVETLVGDTRQLLPTSTLDKITAEESAIRRKIKKFGESRFLDLDNNQITTKRASRLLNGFYDDLEMEQDILMNNLSAMIEESQNITKEKISNIFNEHIKDLFADLQDLPLPILNGLKSQIEDIARLTPITLSADEVQERTTKVRVGQKEVTRKVKVDERWLINPKRWFLGKDIYEDRKELVDVYEERTEEFVDAEELWENRQQSILKTFNNITKTAKQKVEEDTLSFANTFMDFMEKEFAYQVGKIVESLNSKLADQQLVEKQAEEAKEKIRQIQEFKNRLEQTLSLDWVK